MIENKFSEKNKTYLCVGPMSKNCVDASIELAYEFDIDLMLIASRRQIECTELGGGYVNNWDTFSFAKYVKDNDPKGKIILARDHGGPWQHPLEWDKCHSVDEAMKSAKFSFQKDIEAGFQILHIDPVINNHTDTPSLEWVLDKVHELYRFCLETAHLYGKEILIEIGTEEQSVSPLEDLSSLEQLLDDMIAFCDKNNLQKPTFVVVQTGTKVMEMSNIGDFPHDQAEIQEYVHRHRFTDIINACEARGVKLKEHNADYLSDNSLKIHPTLGIHAVNVAPEFGVAETKALIQAMELIKATDELQTFIDICIKSNKWVKWVRNPIETTDLDKTKICGHYLFSNPDIKRIKEKVGNEYYKLFGTDLESFLKEQVKKSIMRYMINFNMIKGM